MTDPILSDYLTKHEAAVELKRNPRTLDRWRRWGVGPPITRMGRTILYRRTSLEKWLASCEFQPDARN